MTPPPPATPLEPDPDPDQPGNFGGHPDHPLDQDREPFDPTADPSTPTPFDAILNRFASLDPPVHFGTDLSPDEQLFHENAAILDTRCECCGAEPDQWCGQIPCGWCMSVPPAPPELHELTEFVCKTRCAQAGVPTRYDVDREPPLPPTPSTPPTPDTDPPTSPTPPTPEPA